MKKNKPSSEFRTFIKDFESHGIDIFAHFDQQQIEKYLQLRQRHTFSQFEFYRHLVMLLDNSESEELDRFYEKLLSIEIKYCDKDGEISNLFEYFARWEPSTFTYSGSWWRGVEVIFKNIPTDLPNLPLPEGTKIVPSGLYSVEEKTAWGWYISYQPLPGRLPDGRKLPIMHPAEFASRKLVSIFTFRQGRIGPAPGWGRDILDVVSLLDARGAFIPAQITEARFKDILAQSETMGGSN